MRTLRTSQGGSVLRTIAIAAVVLAVAVAGWGGWSFYQSTQFNVGDAAVRDEAVAAGRVEVATVTTLDYRDIDAGYKRWLDATAGDLHEELVASEAAGKKQILDAKRVTSATVIDLALTELNVGQGTAKAIALVEVKVQPDQGEAVTKLSRYQAELTKVPAGWKLSNLALVPYIPV